MFEDSIPISLIRQFIFCSRIPFFNEVLGIQGIKPTWIKTGEEHHSKQVILSKQRTLKRFDIQDGKMHYNKKLFSKVLGIHGECDCLIETYEEVVPIEIKNSMYLSEATKLQVIGYGLVAEEIFDKKMQIGFVLLGKSARAQLIEITNYDRAHFFKTLEKLQSTLQQSNLPQSDATPLKCSQCEYLNFCNDRDL